MAAHYLCELAEQALVQGESERARTLLRQARRTTRSCRAPTCCARASPSAGGDAAGALALYLHALESSPELALEIIPAVLQDRGRAGSADMLRELGRRLQGSGRVSPRQLAWLLATAVPPRTWRACRPSHAELALGVASAPRRAR